MLKRLLTAAAGVAMLCTGAQAGEVRVGLGWHDITDTEYGMDVQGEIVFDSPGFLQRIGELKPYLVASTNTEGNLNFAGGGLQYDRFITENWFAEFQFGIIVHDGRIELPPPWEPVERQHVLDTEKTYGCETLFHSVPAIGRKINDRWAASMYLEHLSHGKILCSTGKNEGNDTLGLRLHRTF
ncbi:acyloxyacyl hydrolase [Parvularcula sp. LCG005]|uniref:acyloxyacyl hydrolase n=1 Tax=Parvularcula sp. LCG005 TaxID=3078805 RepID=UPI0029436A30|nr:acyloxyacyl hydrolase [Parvularcula sp. LCG005]WOI53363.1 acyloxyacyl hydrolase [Parvularcula sp. LCG005]